MKTRKIGMFNQLFVILAVLLLIGNAVLGFFAYNRSKTALFCQIQSNVMNVAKCAAVNVNGEILQEIDLGDEQTEEYNTIIEELALFRDNADIEYIYTLRQVEKEKFIFVVDSDTEEPADIGEECEATEALCKAFSDKKTTVDDEAFSDEWGSHVSAYSPICVQDEVVGAVGVDISANWIEEQTSSLRNLVVMICGITYIISILVLGILMKKFKREMEILNDKVKELAGGSGDLTKEIDINSGDELEVIANNMNEFIRQIRFLVKEVADSSGQILLTGEELNRTVKDNNSIMINMNTEIAGISANMQESAASSKMLTESLGKSAEDVTEFSKKVNSMCEMVQQANTKAQMISDDIKENRKRAMISIRNIEEKIERTSEDAQKIHQIKLIAEEIKNIANQTGMLSLNAQIEAARAGSMGAGFAVVATEVGGLSEDISKAVEEINDTNEQVLHAVDELIKAQQEMIQFISNDIVKDYDSFVLQGEEYGKTTSIISNQMEEIGTQSVQISERIAEINKDVQEISGVVMLTAESANELAISTNQIAESFDGLSETSQKNSKNSDVLNNHVKKYTF